MNSATPVDADGFGVYEILDIHDTLNAPPIAPVNWPARRIISSLELFLPIVHTPSDTAGLKCTSVTEKPIYSKATRSNPAATGSAVKPMAKTSIKVPIASTENLSIIFNYTFYQSKPEV